MKRIKKLNINKKVSTKSSAEGAVDKGVDNQVHGFSGEQLVDRGLNSYFVPAEYILMARGSQFDIKQNET